MTAFKDKVQDVLRKDGVVILPPMDAFESIKLLNDNDIHSECTILDPWYNKGFGGVLPTEEYDEFIRTLLDVSSNISDSLYLWGFPEVIGPYVRYAPHGFKMSAWLTWYYKNCPSVIRGWRSSQNACIQFTRDGHLLHPENFLNSEQRERLDNGKMRFIPGPPTVIESPLIIGFVGKKEQTGHPAQKPEAVFDKIILMATKEGDIVLDPMAGSGTTGSSARKNNRGCILCDINEEYIQIMERRLNVTRLAV